MKNIKFYQKELRGMNSIQRLITKNGEFFRVENIANGAHITTGFTPNEFEVGKKPVHGFFSRLGFKQYKPSNNELDWFLENENTSGDFTK